MGLVAQTLRETGVDPLMTTAIEKSHRRTVDAHIAPGDGKVPPLDAALKLLSDKVVRGV
jgi:3-hydroxyisobutyrate dehydrogenase